MTKQTNTQVRWDTPVSNAASLAMVSLVDQDGLHVTVQDHGDPERRRYRFSFARAPIYRNLDESFRMSESAPAVPLGWTRLDPASPWLDELRKREPMLDISLPSCRHYVIFTEDDVLDVIAPTAPSIVEVAPAPVGAPPPGKSIIYHDPDDRAKIDARIQEFNLHPAPAALRVGAYCAGVRGIRLYHEVHGRSDGVPLVLLHGGGSTIEVSFGRVLPIFAAGRTVIAVEEQAHGRSSDRDAPFRFDTSADDVAELLHQRNVLQADFLGFSNGASVALQIAIRQPRLVRKLVFASSMTRRDGARPEFWEFIARAQFADMPQPLKDAFLRVNPDPRQLESMHDKDAERMRAFEDVPDEALRAIRAPTLIVLGDRDVVTPEHALELSRLIPNARLMILPGGHGDYLGEELTTPPDSRQPERTVRMIEEFLGAP